MSGVSQRSLAWKDQLSDVRTELLRGDQEDAIGGYEPNRHRRRKVKSHKRDPFEGTALESSSSRGTKSKQRRDIFEYIVDQGVQDVANSNPDSDRDGVASSNDNGAEGAFMGNDNDNPFLSRDGDEGRQHRRRNHTASQSRQGRGVEGEGTEENEEVPLSPEEQAEEDRKARVNKRVKKAILWGFLGTATAAVVAGAGAVAIGLLRGHKSNIMNL
jgi:hypothetical protein